MITKIRQGKKWIYVDICIGYRPNELLNISISVISKKQSNIVHPYFQICTHVVEPSHPS